MRPTTATDRRSGRYAAAVPQLGGPCPARAVRWHRCPQCWRRRQSLARQECRSSSPRASTRCWSGSVNYLGGGGRARMPTRSGSDGSVSWMRARQRCRRGFIVNPNRVEPLLLAVAPRQHPFPPGLGLPPGAASVEGSAQPALSSKPRPRLGAIEPVVYLGLSRDGKKVPHISRLPHDVTSAIAFPGAGKRRAE